MANEISITSRLAANKGGTSVATATTAFTADMTGTNKIATDQDVGTTYESLSLGDVSTASNYWVQLYNTASTEAATNVVHVSFNASTQHLEIPEGKPSGAFLVKGGITVSVKFAVATGVLGIVAFEA